MDENPNAGRDYFGNYPRFVGGKGEREMGSGAQIGDAASPEVERAMRFQKKVAERVCTEMCMDTNHREAWLYSDLLKFLNAALADSPRTGETEDK